MYFVQEKCVVVLCQGWYEEGRLSQSKINDNASQEKDVPWSISCCFGSRESEGCECQNERLPFALQMVTLGLVKGYHLHGEALPFVKPIVF